MGIKPGSAVCKASTLGFLLRSQPPTIHHHSGGSVTNAQPGGVRLEAEKTEGSFQSPGEDASMKDWKSAAIVQGGVRERRGGVYSP